ncbi:MAG TPA: DUF5683 domain-containing protein [Puia sp.]|nr:DUF5683 domain-containing protein [Puia sp.]
MTTLKFFLAIGGILFFQLASYSQKNDTIPSFIKGKQAVGVNITDTARLHKTDSIRRRSGKDSMDSPYKVDSATRRRHDPRKATLYSTFVPGLGQIYNRKYWKLPLVYAAVGIPVYTYFYNKEWYKKCQFALAVILNGDTSAATLAKVDPKLQPAVQAKYDNSIRSYRNSYRKDQDYSVIFFLLFWGLQIVDATVDAHLKDFDVSNELSMRLQPAGAGSGSLAGSSFPAAATGGGSMYGGVSLVFDLHRARFRPISLP